MLVQDLLSAAMRSIGVIAQEETPSTSEFTDALTAVNDILSSWSPQVLPVLPLTGEVFPTTGVLTYTMGPGGTFNTIRPVKIEALAVSASNGAHRAIRMVAAEEWAAVPDMNRTGLFADVCFIDNGYPLLSLNFSPMPLSGSYIEIHSYKPLTQFVNLTDTINLAPGYTRALRWALAFEMAPEFNRPVSQEMASLAADAKAAITGLNQAVLGKPNSVEPMNPVIPPVSSAPTQAA